MHAESVGEFLIEVQRILVEVVAVVGTVRGIAPVDIVERDVVRVRLTIVVRDDVNVTNLHVGTSDEFSPHANLVRVGDVTRANSVNCSSRRPRDCSG